MTPRTRLIAVSHVSGRRGASLPVHELRERDAASRSSSTARQSVGAIPVERGRARLTTRCRGRSGSAARTRPARSSSRDPERLRVARPSYFAQALVRAGRQLRAARGAARFDPGWLSASSLAGLLAALDARAGVRGSSARPSRPRAAGSSSRRTSSVVPPGDATLVSFRRRAIRPTLVARLVERGVHVREIPGTGLVRVSCGWWTSDEDLERLVAGVRDAACNGLMLGGVGAARGARARAAIGRSASITFAMCSSSSSPSSSAPA